MIDKMSMLKFPLNPNYSVTKDGKVFSHITNKFLKIKKNKGGYLFVRMRINSKRTSVLLHRAVALTFIPNPENKRCINHLNRFREDNRVENLEWATHSENAIHKFGAGYRISSKAKALMSKENFSDKLGYIPPGVTFNGYWHGDAPYNSLTELSKALAISVRATVNLFLKGQIRGIVDGRIQPLSEQQRKQMMIDKLRLENRTL